MAAKKVAVVGGGFMGIACIACLKKEGIEPVCFEKTDSYGGTWCYRSTTEYGVASIMPTTIINHSKEMGAISNFPPPKEFPNYMNHSHLYAYITMLYDHHDCGKHITFNTEVVSVRKTEDYDSTGRWTVTTRNLETNEEATDVFDGVLVCTGHLNRPTMPTLKGQDVFKGKIMHTHSLKEVDEFQDKNVVVVGIGCSALDAAVETSRVAKQVYLSTRSGAYIWNRVGIKGQPIDSILLRRYLTYLLSLLPHWVVSWYLETFYLNKVFDYRLMQVPPKYHILSRDPILNDHIGHKLLCGAVKQKPDIDHLTESGVVFVGDAAEMEADVIIMATGYTWAFPFLEEGVLITKDNMIHLYKCMYPPHLPHATLAIMGFFNPYGPGFPLAELQARWACYNLAHDVKLPTKEIMMKDIVKRHRLNSKRYCPGERMTVRVDYAQYMDEIAEQLGVKPNLFKYLFTDFPLFVRLFFGPVLSYQYRLEGHGKWDGARNAIMTSYDRVIYPLRKKKPHRKGYLQATLEYMLNLIPLNFYVWHY